jgi:hypothetical protein
MNGAAVLLAAALAAACAGDAPIPAQWLLVSDTPSTEGGKGLGVMVETDNGGYLSVGFFACRRPPELMVRFDDVRFVEGQPLTLELGDKRFELPAAEAFGDPEYDGPVRADLIDAFSTASFVRLSHAGQVSPTLAPPPADKLAAFVAECRAIRSSP